MSANGTVFRPCAKRQMGTAAVVRGQATRLARAMVCRYGFSEALGKVSLNYEDMGQTLSSETRAEVEHEVPPPPGPGAHTHTHPSPPAHLRTCCSILEASVGLS